MVSMTSTKIAVSLPSELVEQARRAVDEGRAASISAYVAQALEEQAKLDDLASLLSEMLDETGGPLTNAEKKLPTGLLVDDNCDLGYRCAYRFRT